MFGWQVAAFATHASCISHSFECDDGNTPENDADDWDGPLPNPQPVVQNDQVNPDASDQALKGSQDSNPPGVVTGSIPPNKNDLSQMGVYQNKGTDGHDYLYLYWKRTATLGTANIDFELNQLR